MQVPRAVECGFLQLRAAGIVDIGDGTLGTGSGAEGDLPGKVEVIINYPTGRLAADILIQVGEQVAVAVVGIVDGRGSLVIGVGTTGFEPVL